jgi:aminopeptidase-like protein
VSVADVAPSADAAERLAAFAAEVFPICRSITGDGVRETLAAVAEHIPLELHEVPSGTPVLDWTVPDEWNVRDAYVARNGQRVIDFRESNLHLVSYSEPFRGNLSFEELRPHLHSLPEHPSWVPYRTSYYSRAWGFCLADERLQALDHGDYEVVVDTTLEPGSLSYGECALPGEREEEILLTTHVCHPSLANDNVSGITLLAELGRILGECRRSFSYRLLFIPGTIGSLTWLALNKQRLDRIAAGIVVACVGDAAPLTYKRSRRGAARIDRAAEYAVPRIDSRARVVDFIPWGWDERQFNSPGFDLPVGALSRSREGEFREYHSSADNLELIRGEAMEEALRAVLRILDVLETDRRYRNLAPEGEPQLGRRGLYPTMGGPAAEEQHLAMLWVLNLSDGSAGLLDIAERSGIPLAAVEQAARKLVEGGLLAEDDATMS